MRKNSLHTRICRLRASSHKICSQYNSSAGRTLYITVISGLGNIVLGAGKISFGMLSLSMAACINGCYTLGMVMARYCALAGAVLGKNKKIQYRYYRWSGVILIIASILYIVYSVKIYFQPVYSAYHEYTAIAIAAFTFAEIGINLRGIFVFRKNSSLLLEAIKIINLSASLISLVLTQEAILSFSGKKHDMSNNGILGALMGGCAVLLGMYMLFRIRRLKKTSECRSKKENNRFEEE